MTWYLDSDGNPYTGDRQPGDVEIPPRPDAKYTWADGGWVFDTGSHNAEVFRQLAEIEGRKVRPLTDIALGRGDAQSGQDQLTPRQRLETLEAQMVELRAQLLS